MKEKSYKDNPYRKGNAIASGLLLVIVAVLCFVSLVGGFGGVGKMIRSFMLGFFGLASYAYSVCLFLVGVLIMFQRRPSQPIKNIVLATLIFVFGLIVFQANTSQNMINYSYGDYLIKCYEVDFTAGGMLYGIITYPIMKAITPLATIIVFSLFMVAMAIVMALPLVNKEFTFSFSRKDRPSSYNKDVVSRVRREKPSKVDTPKEPSLTMFDDEQEETISCGSGNISYKRLANDKMADFDGGKSSRFKGFNKSNEYNEDTDFDENMDIASASDSEEEDLRRKEALKKLYPEKKDGLLNYDGTILEDIRKVNQEKEEEDKYKNINLSEIIKQSNTEEGKRKLVDQKLQEYKSMEQPSQPVENTEKPEEKEEELDNCHYVDQYGVKRRYYGLDLQKTIEENSRKMREKMEGDKNNAEELERQKKLEAERLEAERRKAEEKEAERLRLEEEKKRNQERIERARELEKSAREYQLNRLESEIGGLPNDDNDTSKADEFNKIHFNLGVNSVSEPKVEPVIIDENDEIQEDKPAIENVEPVIDKLEPVIEKVEPIVKTTEKPKVKTVDFSYESVNNEEKKKVYDKYDIEEPTGEKFEEFIQEEMDSSPVNANVNAGRRSDFGGTHKKKFMNEENIEFLKMALGKNEEVEQPSEKKVEDEKYPYVPKYISSGSYKYRPPKIDLLQAYDTHYQKADDYIIKGQKIEETLRGLGIETKVVEYTQGPAFSRYELEVDPTINLSKLVNARDNLSLALATKGSVRIEAPISGKSLVGVEVPNDKRATVGLREVISSKEFFNPDSELSFALGKDISGKIFIGDINKLTHLLIAGSTGSGKSVCLNSILASILYKYSPEDVRFILVDPKRVELSVYNGIPHLLIPEAIKEPDQAIAALKWLDREMVRRLELFEEVGSRNLYGYNRKVDPENKLPRIILVIDEFADIMVQSQKIGSEMEDLISRIARMARAVGIHMILATQRPSAEYITGSIKVNIPSRIAFATASSVNSRIIIDQVGAEKLLGNGDMLFVSRDPEPHRMQCPFLSDEEVSNIVDYIKDNNKCVFDDRIEDEIMNCTIDKPQQPETTAPTKIENKAKLDELFFKVLKFLIEDNVNSVPSITKVQREFELGFPRAGKLIDQMQKMGFLYKDNKKYVLNITMSEYEKLLEATDAGEE